MSLGSATILAECSSMVAAGALTCQGYQGYFTWGSSNNKDCKCCDTENGTTAWGTDVGSSVYKYQHYNVHNPIIHAGVFESGSYGNSDDKGRFNNVYKDASWGVGTVIVERECASCAATHQNIFYKRIQNPAGLADPYTTFVEAW